MLFSKETYIARRQALSQRIKSGLIVLMGNNLSPVNYPANAYRFRQDSSFLYYFGQHREGLVGVIDTDEGKLPPTAIFDATWFLTFILYFYL